MTGPPGKEKPQRVAGAGVSRNRLQQYRDGAKHSLPIEIPQDCLRRRPMRPNEIPDVRRVYWAHAAHGTRLPAERGVILIDGGLS